MKHPVRVLTRCDDYGSCSAANQAILECVAGGLAKNVSVLVCGPAFEPDPLRDLGEIDVGLHLCLSSEWDGVKWGPVSPAAEVPSLVEAGGWFTPSPMALFERGFDVNEAVNEFTLQLALLRSAGINPQYVDEHMGVCWLPGLRDWVQEWAAREGLVYLPGLESVDSSDPAALEAQLAGLPDASLRLCINHPGLRSEEMDRFVNSDHPPGFVSEQRDAERRFWTDDRTRAAFARTGAKPIRYSEVGALRR